MTSCSSVCNRDIWLALYKWHYMISSFIYKCTKARMLAKLIKISCPKIASFIYNWHQFQNTKTNIHQQGEEISDALTANLR